jgi:uncharacterized protein (TIGR03083 family)
MVARMGDNGAGQEGGWRQRGLQATDALDETWASLAEVTHELSATEWALPTECPGWNVKDQVSHVIGIERTLMGEAAPAWEGPLGDHVKNDFAAMHEPWIAVRRSHTGPEVHAELVEVTATRLDQLRARSEEEWARVGFSPVGDVPYAVFMEVRVFDCWVHEQDARRALDRPGGAGNHASALSLERMQGAMPFVVGKKAGCAEGTAVRFDIAGTGDDARAFTIAVEGGRAKLVGDDTAAAVTLAMPTDSFVRLSCGRATAAQVEAAGGVEVTGDAAVARSVLDAMNFMF